MRYSSSKYYNLIHICIIQTNKVFATISIECIFRAGFVIFTLLRMHTKVRIIIFFFRSCKIHYGFFSCLSESVVACDRIDWIFNLVKIRDSIPATKYEYFMKHVIKRKQYARVSLKRLIRSITKPFLYCYQEFVIRTWKKTIFFSRSIRPFFSSRWDPKPDGKRKKISNR